MLMIRPSFDHLAKVWFLDKGEVEAKSIPKSLADIEAKSIPELLTKLPKGCVIESYRSLTNPVVIEESTPRRQGRFWLPRGFKRAGESKPPTPAALDNPAPPKRKHTKKQAYERTCCWTEAQYEKAMNMWAMRIPGDRIAETVGLPRVIVSSRMVKHARLRGDPRAVYRLGTGGRSRLITSVSASP